jgi:hypothetical protein
MPTSRAIVVLGMHRNGTSVLTRALKTLGVYIGDNFLETRPDNPTGYWEDKTIVDINERVLKGFGLGWESIVLIKGDQWQEPALKSLHFEAVTYLQSYFLSHSLWGFKDPRTILLLPFWHSIFQSQEVDDSYIIAIRNPLSVASSLRERQNMDALKSHLLWLLYMVPNLKRVAGRPFLVVDYDLLMTDPRKQLARIAHRLDVPLSEADRSEIESFTHDFINPRLRHSAFGPSDFGAIPHISPLTREAYHWLRRLATDAIESDDVRFWSAWERIQGLTGVLISKTASTDKKWTEAMKPDSEGIFKFKSESRSCLPGTGIKVFVVTGTQNTGTDLLRQILNTNEGIAMVAEILTPCPPPGQGIPDRVTVSTNLDHPFECAGTGALESRPGLNYRGHWGNFLRQLPPGRFPAANAADAELLVDQYFKFLLDQIRYHWAQADKSGCRAIGVEIKYNYLGQLAPMNWDASAAPFILDYLRSRGVTLIHATRKNLIRCALSAMIIPQMKIPRHEQDTVIDRGYAVDIEKCLAYARRIAQERDTFLKLAKDFTIIECCDEDLTRDIARSNAEGKIADGPGPLREIARAFGVPFSFRHDGRLGQLVNVPYSRWLSNWDALVRTVEQSEFSAFVTTLE